MWQALCVKLGTSHLSYLKWVGKQFIFVASPTDNSLDAEDHFFQVDSTEPVSRWHEPPSNQLGQPSATVTDFPPESSNTATPPLTEDPYTEIAKCF